MAAAKKNTKPTAASSIPGRSWLGRIYVGVQLIPRGAMLTIIGPVLLAIFGYIGWHAWGSKHFNRAFFALEIEHLDITPQPNWIKRNIVEEVFRNSALNEISLLDRDATVRIAHAFDTHPWIQQTTRVQKLPDMRVSVSVQYRQPLAMVLYEPASSNTPNASDDGIRKRFFYPVDEQGVLLPSEDFSKNQVFDYFLIFSKGARPTGDSGSPFGDASISDALKLCKYLEPHRTDLSLDRIYVYREDRVVGSIHWLLEIETKDRKRFVWGLAPGKESEGEAAAKDKLERLVKCCNVASSPADAGSYFDLRGSQITVSHRSSAPQ